MLNIDNFAQLLIGLSFYTLKEEINFLICKKVLQIIFVTNTYFVENTFVWNFQIISKVIERELFILKKHYIKRHSHNNHNIICSLLFYSVLYIQVCLLLTRFCV